MISVNEADRIVLGAVKPLPIETCSLKQAYGRVLREDINSDRDQPPFDKSTMDGIAIVYEVWQKGGRKFNIEDTVAAGDVPYRLKNRSSCVQIMTGAVLPVGCDCIIPIENVEIEGNFAILAQWTLVNLKQNIRFRAADHKKGVRLLKSGSILSAPQIGVAASVGRTMLRVTKRPRVAIIATGDELVDIGRPVKAHQTRLSNSYALQSLFTQSGLADADLFHLPDQKKTLLSKIRVIMNTYDMIVLSGGVSMGEFDFIPQVLKELGAKALIHKVAQKPGKPFWFGKTRANKPVFALPGNPVSTLVCAYRYVMPYLKKASGLDVKPGHVILKDGIDPKTDLTYFMPVIVKEKEGARYAYPVDIGGSGDFSALAQADGFIQYEHNLRQSVWSYFSWRP